MNSPHVSNQNQCNGRTKFTNERDVQLAKLLHAEIGDDWLPSTGKRKQPANDYFDVPADEPLPIQSHAFFDSVKKAKVKTVHKVRNKDLVLPLVLWWHFWDSSGKPRT